MSVMVLGGDISINVEASEADPEVRQLEGLKDQRTKVPPLRFLYVNTSHCSSLIRNSFEGKALSEMKSTSQGRRFKPKHAAESCFA